MDKSRIRAWLLGAVLLALPLAGLAAGLGKLTLKSALGEPFDAEIEVVTAAGEDTSALVARIAPVDAYRDAGLTYAPALTGIKVSLEQDAGRAFLRATSTRPINEAFLELLIELRYASGRLLREYTVLLDPPVQPRLAPVSPPVAAPPAAEAMPAPAPVAPARALPPVPAEYTVKRGDTLSGIARGHSIEGVSLEQMLVALYRSNEQAFMGKNMNRLKAGSILRIPEAAEVTDLAQAEALGEVRAHARDWNAYRQRLAEAAAAAVPEAAPRQVAEGKIETAVRDEAAAKEAAKDVLRLSKGEAPAAGVAGARAGATLQEELIAKDKALKEANERVAVLEKNIKDMQKLLELKNQELAALQKQAGVQPPAEPAKPAPAEKPAEAAKPVEPAKPEEKPAAPEPPKPAPAPPKPKPKVVAPPPPPSMLDEILGNPLLIPAVLALVVVGVGYVGFNLYRRRKAAAGEGAGVTEPVMEPSAEFERTHILGPGAAAAGAGAAGGEVDELLNDAANLIAWGRHAQAEEILREAMQKVPDRHDIQLRLLEVYAEQKNASEFEYVAKGLYSATGGEGPEWEKAVALGHALDPANPLYGGAPAGAPAEAPAAPAEAPAAPAAPLDIDFGGAPAGEEEVGERAGAEPAPAAVDFDLDLGAPPDATAPNLEVAPAEAAAPESIDFDLGTLEEGEKPAAEPSAEETIISEAPPTEAAEEPASIDFDLGLGGAEEVPAEEEAAPAVEAEEVPVDLGIDLELPEAPAAAPEAAEEEKVEEAGAGVDFNFDIDLGDQGEPAAEEAPAAPAEKQAAAEFSLGDISLDLGEEEAAGAAEPAGSSDVAAKLDLAKAYQEMGDVEGASEILQEVLREGSEGEQQEARELLAKLA